MGKTKVLVIDDEPETVDMLKTFLELFEFEVEGHMTGTGGMQAAIAEQPAVVILDLMLPDADGYQICRLLRHQSSTKSIPVIILSARVGKEDELKGLRAGATVYLRKPVDLNKLVADVRRVVETGHVPPQDITLDPSPPARKTRPGSILKGDEQDEERPPSRPGLKKKTDTVHIPGLYIPRSEDTDESRDKPKDQSKSKP